MLQKAFKRLPFHEHIQKLPWQTIIHVWEQVWLEAAGLAYASLFSLVPLISLCVFFLQAVLPPEMIMPTLQTAIYNLMGETFDGPTQVKFIGIIKSALDRFYAWEGTWVSALSIVMVTFIGFGLVRRIQAASCRLFKMKKPPFKTQMLRATQSICWILLILAIMGIKLLLKHTLPGNAFFAVSFALTFLQLVSISFFLKSFYPAHTTFRASAITTLIGYLGWKALIVLLTLYASFSVDSRTVLGPWAIVPLFLMWIYGQYVYLFICLGLLKELDRPIQKYIKKKRD